MTLPTKKSYFRAAMLAFSVVFGLSALSDAAIADTAKSRAYYDDALGWHHKKKPEAAIIQLKNAIEKDPKNYEARLLTARIHLDNGNLASAEKEILIVHEAEPSTKTRMLLGDVHVARREYQEAIDAIMNHAALEFLDADSLEVLGRAQLGLGDYEAALDLFSRATEIDANHVKARIGTANTYIKRAEPLKAKRILDALLELAPDNLEVHLNRVTVIDAYNNYAALLKYFSVLDEKFPKHPRVHLIKAMKLIEARRLLDAEDMVREFLELNPSHQLAKYLLALTLFQQDRFKEASYLTQQLTALADVSPEAAILDAKVEYVLNRNTMAIQRLRRIIGLNQKTSIEARIMLAQIHLDEGQPQTAYAMIEQLIANDYQDPDGRVQSLAASAAFQLERFKDAQKFFAKLAEKVSGERRIFAQQMTKVIEAQKTFGTEEVQFAPVRFELLVALDTINWGNVGGGLDKLVAVAAKNFDNPEILTITGVELSKYGRLRQAKEHLAAAVAHHPRKLTRAFIELNKVDLFLGNLDNTEARLLTLVEANPGNHELTMRFADLLSRNGKPEEAIAFLQDAVERHNHPDPLVLALLGHYNRTSRTDAADQFVETVTAQSEQLSDRVLYRFAQHHETRGRHGEAARLLARVHENHLDNAEIGLRLANALIEAGERAEALRILQTHIALAPTESGLYEAMMRAHLLSGNKAAAADVIKAGKLAGPALGSYLQAKYHYANGDADKAIEALIDSARLFPRPSYLARAYTLVFAEGRYEDARQITELWIEEFPQSAKALEKHALTFMLLGQYREGLPFLERAIKIDANDVSILNNLALVRHYLTLPYADKLARRAARMSPQTAAILDTLGWILTNKGELDEAVRHLRRARRIEPSNGEIAYHLAVALTKLERIDAAKAHLRAVLGDNSTARFSTSEPEARELLAKLEQMQ